jgi:hypothetical protein
MMLSSIPKLKGGLTFARPVNKSHPMKMLNLAIVVITGVSAMSLSSMRADQPHMQRALEHLRAARAELGSAEHDKGGWRARAIKNVNQAIAETERGMAFDRHH